MTGHGGFQWPDVGGQVKAPDWNPEPICGYGLHGLLWAVGSEQYLDTSDSAKGVVFAADESSAVWIDGDKVKVPEARVVFIGTVAEAAAWIDERKPSRERAGDRGTATAGYRGTATAGDRGAATAGAGGTATAGDSGELRIRWWDAKADRYRTAIAYVGEDGIKANTAYRLDGNHKFVEA